MAGAIRPTGVVAGGSYKGSQQVNGLTFLLSVCAIDGLNLPEILKARLALRDRDGRLLPAGVQKSL